MLSAILIFLAVFCGSFMICDKVSKTHNEKRTNLMITIIAVVLVLGILVLNVAIVGQGISEIDDTDTYISIGKEEGMYQTENGKYYTLKINLFKFWDMYERKYIPEEQVKEILINTEKN